MIFADKVIRLRKRNGWSQEELADKMDVSRQAVSKWESAQTVPALDKLLQLADLFGVTTDYLLKDEMEDEEYTEGTDESGCRRISLDEAGTYLNLRKAAAPRIAAATFLCILAPIPLLLLAALSELSNAPLSENLACAIGLVALLIFVAVAVAIFLTCGFQNTPYEFLEKESFETEYGVRGLAQERKKEFAPTYTRFNIIGTCLCVLSPVALFGGMITEDGLFATITLTITMVVAGIGVIFFILAGVPQASMQKLLQEGEFSVREKKKSGRRGAVSTIYWLAATAIFLGWGFLTDGWRVAWVVWPIAGVLFAGVMLICNLILDRKETT